MVDLSQAIALLAGHDAGGHGSGYRARYPIAVFYGPPGAGKSQIAQSVCRQFGGRYIDYLLDILRGPQCPILGAFEPTDFTQWLDEQATGGDGPLIVDEIDALFATWSGTKREQFFSDILRTEFPQVVVLVTKYDPPIKYRDSKGHGLTVAAPVPAGV